MFALWQALRERLTDRPSWADFYKERTILPVPFATTTTMLEAFVQEGASLTSIGQRVG
jgi:hypothetical protein